MASYYTERRDYGPQSIDFSSCDLKDTKANTNIQPMKTPKNTFQIGCEDMCVHKGGRAGKFVLGKLIKQNENDLSSEELFSLRLQTMGKGHAVSPQPASLRTKLGLPTSMNATCQ